MAPDDVKMMLRISPRLKEKIAAKVAKTGTGMNDLLAEILADHYSVDFAASGNAARPVGASTKIVLGLPGELQALIRADAEQSGESMRNVAVKILSSHFRVKYEPTARWPEPARA